MKERPILFSAPMVQAILGGRKTQTRRVMKPQPYMTVSGGSPDPKTAAALSRLAERVIKQESLKACPHGLVGDLLWVRETGWQPPHITNRMRREGADTWPEYIYDADEPDADWCREMGWIRRPSIFMPRFASRITLEITAVRAERLHDITEDAAKAEGVLLSVTPEGTPLVRISGPHAPHEYIGPGLHGEAALKAAWTYRAHFGSLWDSINGNRAPWKSNPWVFVIQFKRVK